MDANGHWPRQKPELGHERQMISSTHDPQPDIIRPITCMRHTGFLSKLQARHCENAADEGHLGWAIDLVQRWRRGLVHRIPTWMLLHYPMHPG